MEWRSVHDERPRASTSGGQSFGGEVVLVVVAEEVVAAVDAGAPFIMADQFLKAAPELHERHLHISKQVSKLTISQEGK